MLSGFSAIYENDDGLSTEFPGAFFTCVRAVFSALFRRRKWRRSRYPRTTETTCAWLHENGETDSGAPVYGCTCSGSTSEGRAFARAQRRRSSADWSSATEVARAIECSASQGVQISHGFPGIGSSSPTFRWYGSFAYRATPPISVWTHNVSRMARIVPSTMALSAPKAPRKKLEHG